jgi:hypothetical protein
MRLFRIRSSLPLWSRSESVWEMLGPSRRGAFLGFLNKSLLATGQCGLQLVFAEGWLMWIGSAWPCLSPIEGKAPQNSPELGLN